MRLNVYGFLQFFRDFSNCFFSSLFVKNMPKHATRVKGVPGAFVREIRTINCDQPRLAQGPQRADQGPGARDRGHRTRDQGARPPDQGPGILPGIAQGSPRDRPGIAQGSPRDRPGIGGGSRSWDQAPGIAQACQGSPTRARGTRYVYKGSRAAQGGQDRRGIGSPRVDQGNSAKKSLRCGRNKLRKKTKIFQKSVH